MARVSQNLLLDVRDDMFNHLQALSMSYYDRSQMGRIMSRLQNDVFQIQEFLTQFSMTIGDMLTIGAIVVTMFFIDWQLALITLTVVPPLLAIMLIWQNLSWPRFMRVRTAPRHRKRKPPGEHLRDAGNPEHEPREEEP